MIRCILEWIWSAPVVANILTGIAALAAVIGAGATVYIAWLAAPNLKALQEYVKDTKHLVTTSLEQLEASQVPFLALTMQTVQKNFEGVTEWFYELQNQGSGPALNICGLWKCDGSETDNPLFGVTSLGSGKSLNIKTVARIRYSHFSYHSLSGKPYSSESDNFLNIKFLPPPAQP